MSNPLPENLPGNDGEILISNTKNSPNNSVLLVSVPSAKSSQNQIVGNVSTGNGEDSTKSKQPTSKKYQKIKYEIDRQNFYIAKLCRELQMKTERCFPESFLQKLECELCNEKKKLQLMIKHAMNERKRCADENWGPIPVPDDDESLCCEKELLEPPKAPSEISKISAFSNLQFPESMLADYENLEEDRFSLQQEILSKDLTLQELETKFEMMQCKLLKMCQENKAMAQQLEGSQNAKHQQEMNVKLNSQVKNATKLSNSIENLSSHLKDLRNELACLKKEKQIAFDMQKDLKSSLSVNDMTAKKDYESSRPKTCPCKGGDSRKAKLLESQYLNLQSEYCRKEKQCKDMMERMKNLLESNNEDTERAVNEALKKRADEMVAEINDNKVFIRELQQQVDVYREKFMKG